ncbi:MAG: PHP domain-containing protein [Bacillota bacterium]
MVNYNPFKQECKWFKGNLHCHSTNSDGILSPSEIAGIYKVRGWDFLAFTEHGLYTDNHEFNDESFLIIPGIELDAYNPDPGRIYHIVGIGAANAGGNGFEHGDRFPGAAWEGMKTAQSLIDALTAQNNLAVFCHPVWSRLEFDDFKDLHGFFAVELFNNGCELENHTGLCVNYWDSLLRRGKRVWGVAVDDAHHRLKDQCGGWVMVNAPELEHEAIIDALVEGRFYASNGPEIHHYEIKDGEVAIECSPVKAVHFITYENHGFSCWGEGGGTIRNARHKLSGEEKYVRVECEDLYGRTAWTNPVFISG